MSRRYASCWGRRYLLVSGQAEIKIGESLFALEPLSAVRVPSNEFRALGNAGGRAGAIDRRRLSADSAEEVEFAPNFCAPGTTQPVSQGHSVQVYSRTLAQTRTLLSGWQRACAPACRSSGAQAHELTHAQASAQLHDRTKGTAARFLPHPYYYGSVRRSRRASRTVYTPHAASRRQRA